MPLTISTESLARRISGARSVLVLTGAGVSVASGIPTYRGDSSSAYNDPERLRYAFGSTLRRDPEGFWRHFGPRRHELASAQPNAAHRALASLEERTPRFLLATQNVDDMHARAGSRSVVELHGNAFRERCLDETCPIPPWRRSLAELPRCPRCGGVARPDVVLFGEANEAPWQSLRAFLSGGVDVLLLVGTSGTVEVPNQLVALARERSSPFVVEINPRPNLDSLVEATVSERAEEALPGLVSTLRGR